MRDGHLKRVVIACGGTGGHFYPGYALAKELAARGWEALFVLRCADPARRALDAEDLPYVEVDLRGMPRGLSVEWARLPWRLLRSLRLSRKALKAYRPRCVVGMGGYLTFPVVFSAWRLRIPSLIHESNAMLGLANRLCLPFVSKVALGLPPASGIPRARYELTGTPVREAFWKLPDPAAARRELGLDPQKPTLLVFGGSQGARGLNELVPRALKALGGARPDSFQCVHLSGAADEPAVRSAYEGIRARAVVLPYLQEIHKAYAAADLVVSRAGASTVAELVAARKPAILIPFPAAAGGHQDANTELLVRAGAALSFRQAELTSDALAGAVSRLLFSRGAEGSELERMSERFGRLELPPPRKSLESLVRLVEAL